MNAVDEIFTACKDLGLSDVVTGFVICQAAHETGGFKSNIFLRNNNAFGMKYAGQKNADGEARGYALYKSLYYSVADLVEWIRKRRTGIMEIVAPIKDLPRYVSFLKNNNYFEDSEETYLKGCEYWYNKIF